MAMKALRDSASGGVGKFILFGFLVLATGGLVLADVGGFFRGGGVAKTDVARVAGQTIPVSEFDRSVRLTLRRLGMSPQDAYKFGYMHELLRGEIRSRLTYQIASDLGFSVSQEQVAAHIHALIAPLIQEGQSAQDTLNQILLSQGVSESQMIQGVRRDMVAGFLTDTIAAGFAAPSPFIAQDVWAFQKETRKIELVEFPDSDITDIPPPSEEQLKQLYTSMRDSYTIPEMRTYALIRIRTETLKNTLDISEEELRDTYDSQIEHYAVPEKRSLEQAILEAESEANAVFKQTRSGTSLKDAVTKITGSDIAYLGEKDFEKASLLDLLQDPVFSAQAGTILGPIETPLGWHVIKVSKIEPAHTKSFEDVRGEIREELLETKVIDQSYELANLVDDMLAGGASLEEVAEAVDLEITLLPPMNAYGQDADGKDALRDYAEDRTAFLDTGAQLEEGETSAVFETQDGHFVAINLKERRPKSYVPFAEVKNELEKRWIKDQRRAENKTRTMKILNDVRDSENMTLKSLAQKHGKPVQTLGALRRDSAVQEPLTPEALTAVFEAPIKGLFTLNIDGGMAIARIVEQSFPAPDEQERASQQALLEELLKAQQSEALNLYLESKSRHYGVRINDRLLERVYGPGAEGY